MSSEDRFRTLLADLGRATLRGVRKCPKCGTYNGSRGSYCKNKYCDAVFKEPGEKRKLSTEACKLITGSSAHVFSVHVRDKDPDHRGFVQIPLVNSTPTVHLTSKVYQSSALCFVDNCEKSFNNSVLQCHEKHASATPTLTCQHVQAALRCYAEAQPLTLRNSILSSLNVNNETKQEIWLLATESSGPLVQRVSKNIMAVKCKVSPKHPLGYLHFSFFTTKLRDRIEHKFCCSCSSFTIPNKISKSKVDESTVSRCIHFYACICAFASDPKLSEEFQYYINLDQIDKTVQEPLDFEFNTNETDKLVEIDLDSLSDDTHLLIFRDDSLTVQNLQADRLDIDSINLDPSLLSNTIVDNIKNSHGLLNDTSMISKIHNLEIIDQNAVFDGSIIKFIQDPVIMDKFDGINNYSFLKSDAKLSSSTTLKVLDHNLLLDANSIKLLQPNDATTDVNQVVLDNTRCKTSTTFKRKREESKNLSTVVNPNSVRVKKSKTKSSPTVKNYPDSCENIDELNTSLSFIRWLSSITERINQTMHFQFNGKPDPLVFQIPQMFFECLRERISCGATKKRLPNSTTAFVRKDGVPGTFTKYTWQITNILHVKSIFETPLIPLEITRSFVQNKDGTYKLYKREETEIDRFKKTGNNALIKPMELKTYLKVGNTSPTQVQPTPFLIEWIPDILPISKIGELKIRFEFGHVKNESPPMRWKKSTVTKNF